MTPVLCGSSFKNKGVQPLLDAVIDLLPSPLDVLPAVGLAPGTEDEVTREADPNAPVLGARVQGDERPLRGPPDLPAGVLRHDRHRREPS